MKEGHDEKGSYCIPKDVVEFPRIGEIRDNADLIESRSFENGRIE